MLEDAKLKTVVFFLVLGDAKDAWNKVARHRVSFPDAIFCKAKKNQKLFGIFMQAR